MDSLYESAHDNRDPIQGGGGVTDDSSWLMSTREEKIASFDGNRTASAMSHRLQATNRTLDPIEHLPPELSTCVITQALPPQGKTALPSRYPSRLIELTTVSKKWQRFLFSTPVLWSELYLDESQGDYLATLSVFVKLSSNAPVELFLRGEPTGIDWTGLAFILFPAAERVTRLHFGIVADDGFDWVPNVLSNLLERLCRLPRLKEVKFDTVFGDGVSLFRIKSFGLPSTVKFNGLFRIKLPKNCWASGTSGRFFDVTKCNTQGTLGRLVSPSQPDLLLFEYLTHVDEAYIISNGATLLELESVSEPLAECKYFEHAVHTATFTLHDLQVYVDLSQTEDLLDCIRMLMRLRVLQLEIRRGDGKITRDRSFINTTSRDLRRFELGLVGGVENLVEAQKPLGDLFSALGILYPGVEEVHIRGNSWTGRVASYLQDLKALKSLVLSSEASPFSLLSEPITLQSLQCLEIRGLNRIDSLHTPNLLKLVLHLRRDVPDLNHLGAFPPGLRSLVILLDHNMEDCSFTSLDCPDLRDLYLASRAPRASWGFPSLSNLVSITIRSTSQSFTDSSNNQLCITLLCNPWRLPSLRQLHFTKCVEWDVLFLMLKRRNYGESGVQRIDTVTLPFIPFTLSKLLTRLLAGKIVELPSLISLSLEATREVMFDASVPGCFACMKNMRLGCTKKLISGERRYTWPAAILYPPEDPIHEETPQELQDWLSQRRKLVDIWKASYEGFTQDYARLGVCSKWYIGSDEFSLLTW